MKNPTLVSHSVSFAQIFSTQKLFFSTVIAMTACFGVTSELLADRDARGPNFVRGPIRTSIKSIRDRYSDATFSGGSTFQREVSKVVPANGTAVASRCLDQLSVGMKVKATVATPSGMRGVAIGDVGVVLSSAVSGEILVEWIGNHVGHDGMGNGAKPFIANDGDSRWFVQCHEVLPLEADPLPIYLMDFTGMIQAEKVQSFYDQGNGSLGSGPGPNFGANFDNTSDLSVFYSFNGSNEPSPGVVTAVSAGPVTMNLDNPIRTLAFKYSTLVPVVVRAYSGLNGQGSLVAESSFSQNTPTAGGGGIFNTWSLFHTTWPSNVHSVVWSGSTNQWAMDTIEFTSIPPAIQLVAAGSPSCVAAPSSQISYDLQVIAPPFALVSGQFFVEWDTTAFAFLNVSAGDAPFTSIPFTSVNAGTGRVFLIASVEGGGTGTSESRTVARLHFQALTANCSPTVPQVRFLPAAVQLLTDGQGGSATLPLTNPIPVRIDGIAPVITGTPASITVDADAIPGCSSQQTVIPPTASDNCEVSSFTFSRSDGQSISAPFPCGTTTMTWVATDPCGFTATTSSSVTVNPFQSFFVEVQMSGATGNFQRCVTLNMIGETANYTTSEVFNFSYGIASRSIRVPAANYACVTADDRLHSLSRPAQIQSGVQYFASFVGANALILGDLTNDNVIDVVDYGVMVVRIGQGAPVNTNCETPTFHADLNADGSVTSVDGQLLLDGMLMNGVSCASGVAGDGDIARQSISVKELTEMGLANAELCDIDHNGIVDLFDMLLWQEKNSKN